jgi:hypothetical protein
MSPLPWGLITLIPTTNGLSTTNPNTLEQTSDSTSALSSPTPAPNNASSSAEYPKQLYIVEVAAAIVGAVAACVGAAFALARWKQNNITAAIPTTAATSPNIMTSSIPIITATAVPQSANVYNTPMLSQRNITLINQC